MTFIAVLWLLSSPAISQTSKQITVAEAEKKVKAKIIAAEKMAPEMKLKAQELAAQPGREPKGFLGNSGGTAMMGTDTDKAVKDSYQCNKESGFGLPNLWAYIKRQFPGATLTTGVPVGICIKTFPSFWGGCSIWHSAFLIEYRYPVARIETSDQRFDSLRNEPAIEKVFIKTAEAFKQLLKLDFQLRNTILGFKLMGPMGIASGLSDSSGEIFDKVQESLKQVDPKFRYRALNGESIDFSQLPELAEIMASSMSWLPHKSHTQKPFWWSNSPVMYPLTSTFSLSFAMFPKAMQGLLAPLGEGACTEQNVSTGRTPAEFAGQYAPRTSALSKIPGGNKIQGKIDSELNKNPALSTLNSSKNKDMCLKNVGRTLPLHHFTGGIDTDNFLIGMARAILRFPSGSGSMFTKGRAKEYRNKYDGLTVIDNEYMRKNIGANKCYYKVEDMVKTPLDLPPGAKIPGESHINGGHIYRRLAGTHGWPDFTEWYWLTYNPCPSFCIEWGGKLPGFFSDS